MIKQLLNEIKTLASEKSVPDIFIAMGVVKESSFLDKNEDEKINTIKELLISGDLNPLNFDFATSIKENPKILEALESIDEDYKIYVQLMNMGATEKLLSNLLSSKFPYPYITLGEFHFIDKIYDLVNVDDFFNNDVFVTKFQSELHFVVSDEEKAEFVKTYCAENGFTPNLLFSFDFFVKEAIQGVTSKEGIASSKFAKMMEFESNKSIIMATGIAKIDELVKHFDNFIVLDIIQYREKLLEACLENKPDIVVVSDSIGGKQSLYSIIIKLKQMLPTIRIVYFAGDYEKKDEVRENALATMVVLGIYDIIFENEMSIPLIQYVLTNPRSKESASKIGSRIKDISDYSNKKRSIIEVTLPDDDDILDDSESLKNLYSIISGKNGTGKSFLAYNVAIAISSMGVNNLNGKKPKIAIIDTDIASFDISNMFGILSNEKSIINAVGEIKHILNKEGQIIASDSDMAMHTEAVRKMFTPIPKYKNIEILSGCERNYSDSDSNYIKTHDFVYLIESIYDEYDVVIIDVNTDIEFSTFYPLFSLSRNIYNVLDMDFNSFKANKRLFGYWDEIGNTSKFRYILNKYIDDEKITFTSERMEESLNYEFEAKIPKIDDVIMLNSLYNNDPIILNADKSLLKTRFEIIKVANQLWPIKNFDKLAIKMGELEESKKPEIIENKKKGFPVVKEFVSNLIESASNPKKINEKRLLEEKQKDVIMQNSENVTNIESKDEDEKQEEV